MQTERLSSATIAAARDGDRTAANELGHHVHVIARVILRRDLRRPPGGPAVEDLCQAAFLHVWRKIGGFRADRCKEPSGWLFTTIKRAMMSELRLRRSRPMPDLGDDWQHPHTEDIDRAEMAETVECLLAEVDDLPDLERNMVTRRYGLDGLPAQPMRTVARGVGLHRVVAGERCQTALHILKHRLGRELGLAEAV
jgi:RNA polymerase sigma factor (sigma-70 family)